jgi:hypothetical protein
VDAGVLTPLQIIDETKIATVVSLVAPAVPMK